MNTTNKLMNKMNTMNKLMKKMEKSILVCFGCLKLFSKYKKIQVD